MIIRFASGEVAVLDYRETAPTAATADMYVRADLPDASRNGHLAVAVPSTVAGQCQALAQFGTLSLARVLAPAIRLARDGFPVDEHYVDAATAALAQYDMNPSLKQSCNYVYRTHLGNGQTPSVGQRLTQPHMAEFLKRLAKDGPDFFYRGEFAQDLHREMAERGGIIRASDLGTYRVRQRQPIVGSYRGLKIITMPPPSSGGVAIIQTLNTLERVNSERNASLARHNFTEAMKHAFADRARWMADPDFVDIPVDLLTSTDYSDNIADCIGQTATSECHHYGTVQLPDDSGTSHFCVVDRWGNAVVATETINTSFGSLAAIDKWGVILNNEMDDFTTRPGQPNAYGLTQSDRNAVEARKRPLSSMCPTIVLEGDKPVVLIGASGGPRIISSVLNVLINVIDFDMPPEEAITTPRLHHQWLPDEIYFDRLPPADLAASLTARGHRIATKRKKGVVQAIVRTPDGWLGACDPHKGGRPAGY